MLGPKVKFYSNQETGICTVFDIRIPGMPERFSRERTAWGECADVEMLDLDHPVLIVRPGRARRLAT